MQQELPSSESKSYILLSDLANKLKIPAYRLRSWEVLYPFIKSVRDASGRRFYDAETVEIFEEISRLLYQEGRKNTEISALLSQRFSRVNDSHSTPDSAIHLEGNESAEVGTEFSAVKGGDVSSLEKENILLKEGVRNLLDSLNKLGKTIVSQEGI